MYIIHNIYIFYTAKKLILINNMSILVIIYNNEHYRK
jgi:hypothetical protein